MAANSINTVFPSVSAFIEYFKDHDELVVEAGQPLVIRNISILNDDSLLNEKECEGFRQTLALLNRAVQPLAKTLFFRFPQSTRLDYKITKDELSFTVSNPTLLKAEKGTIYTRISDLMRLMLASSISKVTFAPDQSMTILGLSAEEKNFQGNAVDIYNQLIERRACLGVEIQTKGKNVHFNSTQVIIGNASPQEGYSISGKELSLTLQDTFTFYGFRSFRKRLELASEITIPSELTIVDSRIPQLYRTHQEKIKDAVDFVFFAINQMLLPLGKTIVFDDKGGNAEFELKNDVLKIKSPSPFSLTLSNGDIVCDLEDLSQELIDECRSALTLKPNQDLIIYNFDPKEVSPWVISNDPDVVIPEFGKFLAKRNPIGFVWNLSCAQAMKIALNSSKTHENISFLRISSPEGIKITLERPNGAQFILNLLQNSHPNLAIDLVDYAPEATFLITFKAIFYYCCDDYRHFRNNDLPAFFKEETQAAILKIVSEDTNFANNLQEIIESGEDNKKLNEILGLSPEEFDALAVEGLSKPLKTVIGKLRELTYRELQGESLFSTACIKCAVEYLESQDKSESVRKALEYLELNNVL